MFLEPTEWLLTGDSTESIWMPKSVNSAPHHMRSCTQEFFSHTHCWTQEPTRAPRRFSSPHKKLCHLHLLCSPPYLHLRNSPHFHVIHNHFHRTTNKVIEVPSTLSALRRGKSSMADWLYAVTPLIFLLLTTNRRTSHREDPASAHRPHPAMHLRSPCRGVTVGDNAANVWHVR